MAATVMAMTPLADLIEQVKKRFLDEQGIELTNGDIARRGGNVITRGRVQQLATGPVDAMPNPATVAALAKGLAVPEHMVLERALSSVGYGDPTITWRYRRDSASGHFRRETVASTDEYEMTILVERRDREPMDEVDDFNALRLVHDYVEEEWREQTEEFARAALVGKAAGRRGRERLDSQQEAPDAPAGEDPA